MEVVEWGDTELSVMYNSSILSTIAKIRKKSIFTQIHTNTIFSIAMQSYMLKTEILRTLKPN